VFNRPTLTSGVDVHACRPRLACVIRLLCGLVTSRLYVAV